MHIKKFWVILPFLCIVCLYCNIAEGVTYKIKSDVVPTGVYPRKSSKVKGSSAISNSINSAVYSKSASEILAEYDIAPLFKRWDTLKAYNLINLVGEKLLSTSGINEAITFSVVSSKSANAATNIHNEVLLYTGILKYVETEDELAAIMAHEIGHAIYNDPKKSVARKALILGAAIAGSGTDQSAEKVAVPLAGATYAESKISKSSEYRADITSIDMLVNAGYNPLAIISILNKISESKYSRSLSHPMTSNRLKSAYIYIKNNYPQYIQQGYPTISYQSALRVISSGKNF